MAPIAFWLINLNRAPPNNNQIRVVEANLVSHTVLKTLGYTLFQGNFSHKEESYINMCGDLCPKKNVRKNIVMVSHKKKSPKKRKCLIC